ncbi:MAG: hypothetical protein KAY32_08185 [Candidatus Eisenbacteria sp.]|nr:hypothetical protein [Candidatus Eisenbacteria bacterium]
MHLDQNRLVKLLRGGLSEEDATQDLGHLAICDRCSERLAALRQISSDFEGSWTDLLAWLAEPDAPAEAQETAGAATPERHASPLAFALRIFLDSKNRIATAGTRLVETLSSPAIGDALRLSPSYSGVGDAEQAPEVNRRRTDAAEMIAGGDVAAARKALRAAAELSPDAAVMGGVEGLTLGGVPIEVVVDAARPAISVIARVAVALPRVKDAIRKTGAAVLMTEDGAAVRREPFRPVEGADYLLAEFEDVGDGSWIIGVDFDQGG